MNTLLEKTFAFSSIVAAVESEPWINHYEVAVRMCVRSDQSSDYNIAYSRMKFWFTDVMQDAVLLGSDHAGLPAWRETGLRCLDFPHTPIDQVVALMLMSKLTAIVEHRIEIQQIGVTSAADDFITYICDCDEHLHWFESAGWWNDPSPVYCTGHPRHRNEGKIIAITRNHDWKSHDLAWCTDNVTRGNVSLMPPRDEDA